jgi:hypothetical protein
MVAGSEHVFNKVSIAVPPTVSGPGTGRIEVGKIFGADGSTQRSLSIADASAMFTPMLRQALSDAGLNPVALDSNPANGKPPPGVDFILDSEIKTLAVNKMYGANETVHGQYFDMKARVVVKYRFRNRDGKTLAEGEVSGVEKEPPAPVGKEVFLPLETEPGESLSVALSRALGKLILLLKESNAFPTLAPTPSPTK